MNIDLIEKNHREVTKKYPNAKMQKNIKGEVLWFDEKGRIATLIRNKFNLIRK